MCGAIFKSLVVFGGLGLLVFGILSLYVFDGSFLGIFSFICSIDFAVPRNGTLNAKYPFYNLTSFYLGSLNACFKDNETYASFSQHGRVCTPAAIGFSMTLSDVYGNDQTIIASDLLFSSVWTWFLFAFEVIDVLVFLAALYYVKDRKVQYTMVFICAFVVVYMAIFVSQVTKQFDQGVVASAGTSTYAMGGSVILLLLAIHL